MKIQRFEAQDLQRALRMAQQALGPEAVILQTRRVPEAGVRGFLGGRRVEILAAVDIREESSTAAPGTMTPECPSAGVSAPRPLGAPAPERSDAWQSEWELLRSEVADLRLQLARANGPPTVGHLPRAAATAASRLDASGVGPGGNPAVGTSPGAGHGEQSEPLTLRPIEIRSGSCTAVALVGPTGIGKTTTLAKLAAVAKGQERKRVAFATVDHFRVGAVEQIETYARLQDIPLAVVRSPEEMQRARDRYGEYDLLLVDTTGRPARQEAQIRELALLLQAARLDEVHLLLEARQSLEAHRATLEGYRLLQPTHLLLSKLDEAARREDTLTAAMEGGLPLSYVTTGQRVPEDLALAEVSWLAEWARGGA